MSNSKLERTYRCQNDCAISGCPSHVATLEYYSESDAFLFRNGKSKDFYGHTPEFGALLSMLNELAGQRDEVSSMIEEAQKDSDELHL